MKDAKNTKNRAGTQRKRLGKRGPLRALRALCVFAPLRDSKMRLPVHILKKR